MLARIHQSGDRYILSFYRNDKSQYDLSIGGTVRWEFTLKLFKDLKVKEVIIDHMTDEYFDEDLTMAGFVVRRMDV